MDSYIEITENDLMQQGDRLKTLAGPTETLIDIEKGLFVNLGIPTNGHGAIVVPNKPHVFIADELHLIDGSHPQGVLLKDTPLIMAHGVRDQNDRWNFQGGQSVVDTVEAYKEYAKKERLPAIEFVAACNDDPITHGTGVQIHEFGSSGAIAHAVGETMNVSGVVEDNGLTRVYIRTQDNIVNLDQLTTLKEININ